MSESEDNLEACGKCEFLMLEENGVVTGIQCNECTQWFHYNCVNANAFQLYLMTSSYEQTMTCINCVENSIGKDGLRDAVKAIRKKAKLEAEWLASLKQEIADRDEELARKESAEGDKSPNSDVDPGQCKGGVSNDADRKSLRETPLAQGQVPNPKSDPKGKTQEPKKVPKKAPISREDKSKRKTKVCWHYTYNLCKRKDAECDFIHPPACKKALQKKACFKQQCNYTTFARSTIQRLANKVKANPVGIRISHGRIVTKT